MTLVTVKLINQRTKPVRAGTVFQLLFLGFGFGLDN